MHLKTLLCGAGALALIAATGAHADSHTTTVTIATVNNGDMIRMQGLTDDFTSRNPDIALEWVTLEENVLRQRVTQDIAAKGGQFDVLTIGTYEVPIWGSNGWLVSLNDLPAEWDVDDLLPAIRNGLTVDGELYAAPFYGESSMVMYRTDLMEKAGLQMPDAPTWEFIREAAAAMTDKDNEVYGVCLRGKAGWGENMAFLTATANSFGARWFDENWQPQFDSEAWANALHFYMDLMTSYGPPGASTNGFNENLSLFQQGQVRHVDRCHRGRLLRDQPERLDGGRQRRIRPRPGQWPRQARQLAVGVVAGDSGGLGCHGRGEEVHRLGHRQGVHRAGRVQGRLGQRPARHPDFALREPGVPRSGTLRRDDAQLDQRRRPDAADRRSGALYRRPVRRDSGVCGHRHAGGQEFSAALAGQQSVAEALEKAQALTADEMEAAGY